MAHNRLALPILVADDDPDDRMMAREALQECCIENALYLVEDGEDLLDFLRQQGQWTAPAAAPRPGLILLDLNMPRKNGREALMEIKNDPLLRSIPVVVLTTSEADEDLEYVTMMGAEGFITKPVTFDGLVKALESLTQQWLVKSEPPMIPEGTPQV